MMRHASTHWRLFVRQTTFIQRIFASPNDCLMLVTVSTAAERGGQQSLQSGRLPIRSVWQQRIGNRPSQAHAGWLLSAFAPEVDGARRNMQGTPSFMDQRAFGLLTIPLAAAQAATSSRRMAAAIRAGKASGVQAKDGMPRVASLAASAWS